MNRSDLIKQVARELNLPNRQVKAVLDCALARVAETVVAGESVRLKGFGTFNRHWLPPRQTRHPVSGRLLHVHPRYTLRFRFATNVNRALKELIERFDSDGEHGRARRIAHTMASDLKLYHGDLIEEAQRGNLQPELVELVEELRSRFRHRVSGEVIERRDYLYEELASLLSRRALDALPSASQGA